MGGVGVSYYPDYFSLEDILATQERLPVEVLQDHHLSPAQLLI